MSMPVRALAIALAASVAACGANRALDNNLASAGHALQDTLDFKTFSFDEPLDLKTKGPLTVHVDSFAGDVHLVANPKAKSTTVEVRRVSNMGWGRWEESREELADIKWTATLDPRTDGGQTLQVRISSENPEPHFFRTELTIETPMLDAVAVRTKEGDVSVMGNQGPVDIETTRGDVRMCTPWPMTRAMKIITSGGSIDYRVRGESRGAFDCESHGGEVRQRCEFGRWDAMAKGNDQDRLMATLNDGTNPVFLRTSEKNIRVAVVSDPTNVGREIMDP